MYRQANACGDPDAWRNHPWDIEADWNDMYVNQGRPRTACKYRELQEAKRYSPLWIQRECGPANTLILDF